LLQPWSLQGWGPTAWNSGHVKPNRLGSQRLVPVKPHTKGALLLN
jgi:hypothetical protein